MKTDLEVIKEVRSGIAAGGWFICPLISSASSSYQQARRLRRMVEQCLGRGQTFGGWQFSILGRWPTDEEQREGRLAWLDKWIEESEAAQAAAKRGEKL